MILPALKRSFFQNGITKEEFKSVYWQLLLGIEHDSNMKKGKLMCFSYENNQASTGLEWVEYSTQIGAVDIENWQIKCPLPNMKNLFKTLQAQLKRYFDEKSTSRAKFNELTTHFIRDHEIVNYFSHVPKGEFQLKEFCNMQTRADIINELLLIMIIQDKSTFRFDGNRDSDVIRIQKRKLESTLKATSSAADSAKLLSALGQSTQIGVPMATQKLLASIQNKHLTSIKREEQDTRSTNVKNICTYFKDSFRNALLAVNLTEQCAWTILAEIVTARTQCGNYCTMRELSQVYPVAVGQIKEDMKSKGYETGEGIPSWDLAEINDQLHRLTSIFEVNYEKHESENFTKSVTVNMGEDDGTKYRHLMAEYAQYCHYK